MAPGKLEFQDWVNDAASILENLGSAQNIVISHSMGSWISLLLATQERFKNKVQSMILISPGLNFFRPFYADLFSKLPQYLKEKLDSGEVGYFNNQIWRSLKIFFSLYKFQTLLMGEIVFTP